MNSLSQANFIKLMSDKIFVARNDMEELQVYGVLLEDLDNLDNKLITYNNLESDSVYLTIYKESNHAKKEVREVLLKGLRALKLQLQVKYGKEMAKPVVFYIKGITTAGDKELINSVGKVVDEIMKLPEEVAENQIIQKLIEDLRQNLPSFEQRSFKAEGDRAIRKQKTEDRNTLKNEIYEEVTTICEIGKAIWKNRDIDQFHRYVLFPGQGQK